MSCDVTGFARRTFFGLKSSVTRHLNLQNMAESDSNPASSSSEDRQQNEESGIDELEVRIRPALP